jgi:hypothetical protein
MAVEFAIKGQEAVRLMASVILSSHSPVHMRKDGISLEIDGAEDAAFRADRAVHGFQ